MSDMVTSEQLRHRAPRRSGLWASLWQWFTDGQEPGAIYWPTREDQRRSLELLKRNLSPVQRAQYEKHSYFDVLGGKSGTRYRIHHCPQMNVRTFDKHGRVMQALCFMPEGYLPLGDILLAQKLALELFEDDVLRVARKSHPYSRVW